MKKRYVLLQFILILTLVGCKDDTLEVNEINNDQTDVEEVSGEQKYEVDSKIDVGGQQIENKD